MLLNNKLSYISVDDTTRSHVLTYGTLLVLALITIFSNLSPKRILRTKNKNGIQNSIAIKPACQFDKCCKECSDDEVMNVIVRTKNDSGQDFTKIGCAKKINDEVVNKFESSFPLLYVELCPNDWSALENNHDIDFIEQDSNQYYFAEDGGKV